MKTYRSERNVILGISIWAAMLASSFFVIKEQIIGASIVFILIDVLLGLIWFGTKYTIHGSNLTIFLGPIRITSIAIQNIRKIKKTRSVVSSPANSLDRIEIMYNRFDSILISPIHRNEFLNELLRINPKIEINVKGFN